MRLGLSSVVLEEASKRHLLLAPISLEIHHSDVIILRVIVTSTTLLTLNARKGQDGHSSVKHDAIVSNAFVSHPLVQHSRLTRIPIVVYGLSPIYSEVFSSVFQSGTV